MISTFGEIPKQHITVRGILTTYPKILAKSIKGFISTHENH